jgi:hypothetical protein
MDRHVDDGVGFDVESVVVVGSVEASVDRHHNEHRRMVRMMVISNAVMMTMMMPLRVEEIDYHSVDDEVTMNAMMMKVVQAGNELRQ